MKLLIAFSDVQEDVVRIALSSLLMYPSQEDFDPYLSLFARECKRETVRRNVHPRKDVDAVAKFFGLREEGNVRVEVAANQFSSLCCRVFSRVGFEIENNSIVIYFEESEWDHQCG